MFKDKHQFSEALEPEYQLATPPTPQRKEAIKNLRMIADDIEKGYEGFNFFVGYDFINIANDIMSGEERRKTKINLKSQTFGKTKVKYEKE